MITQSFSKHQLDTLTALNVTFSLISIIGSGFIVVSFLLFKDLRKLSFKLVFWLSFSDLVAGLSTLMGSPEDGSALCYVQAYFSQFFTIASFAWTTTIAFTLYFTVIMHRGDVADYYWHFHAFVWGLAFVLLPIPQIFDDYGNSGYWCWIRNETLSGKLLRVLCFYMPLWGAIVFNAVTYFRVIRQLNLTLRLVPRDVPGGMQSNEIRAVARLGFYPLILIACWLAPTANRIQNWVEPDRPIYVLYCVSLSTSCMQGCLNSVAYGLNITVQKNWRNLLVRWGLIPRRWGEVRYGVADGDDKGEGVSMVTMATSHSLGDSSLGSADI